MTQQHNSGNHDGNRDSNQDDEQEHNWYDWLILALKIIAFILLIGLLFWACDSSVPDKPHVQQHGQQHGQRYSQNGQPSTQRTGKPNSTNKQKAASTDTTRNTKSAQTTPSVTSTSSIPNTPSAPKADPLASIKTIDELPGDYKLRMAQIADILNMMLDIRLSELKAKGFSDAEIAMMQDGYKTIYSATHTSPKVIIQLNHILMERDRALAQQLTIDYTAYKADTNLVDIVRYREKKPTRKN